MLAAKSSSTAASASTTAGLPSTAPKAAPVRAAATPSAEKTRPMPTTYAVVNSSARARLVAPRAPKTLIVMGMRGYTHGVSAVSSPPRNTTTAPEAKRPAPR